MLNALRAFPERTPDARNTRSPADTVRPRGRLVLLGTILCVPLIAVWARIVQLTVTGGADRFRASRTNAHDVAYVEWEAIPAPSGRIVTADGVTLAEDRVRYTLQIHFRWLETPPDPDWLRDAARAALRRGDLIRSEPQQTTESMQTRLHRAMQRVEQTREELRTRLARTLRVPRHELEQRCRKVQQNVERIRRRVRQASRDDHDGRAADEPSAGLWEALLRALAGGAGRGPDRKIVVREELKFHTVFDDIPRSAAVYIQAHPELFPGTRVVVAWKRVYPRGRLAAHWIGLRTPLLAEDLDGPGRARLFPDADRLALPNAVLLAAGRTVGRSGLEKYYDGTLAGMPGFRALRRNAYGEIIESSVVVAPRRGRDLVLNVDARTQAACERLLDARIPLPEDRRTSRSPQRVRPKWESDPTGGAIVVLDVATGRVVAAASAPGFDLTALVADDEKRRHVYFGDPRHPLVDRVRQMAIAPGSSFKVLTALAALQADPSLVDAPFHCRGYLDAGHPDRYRCYVFRHFGVGHGALDFQTAFAKSCNVYFYTLGERVGPLALWMWARRLGFGMPTGLDLPAESSGTLPSPFAVANTARKDESPLPHVAPTWHRSDTLGLSIGQGRLAATPLQMVRLVAAIANGGWLVQPRLAHADSDRRDMLQPPDSAEPLGTTAGVNGRRRAGLVVAAVSGRESTASDSGGESRDPAIRFGVPLPIAPRTLELIRKAMFDVVNRSGGTGYRYARSKKVILCGKTGTAQVARGGDHAWFVGFLPASRPRFAFVVVLEHGGSGGRDAGPIARRLAEYLNDRFLEPPEE
ncbi:MAG: hypothetical protein D6725_09895 [Planctomycetota bacterium]|nr:MAG: hypothetical protein D6725_09895 [Planctomycetota bacterium]